MLAEVLERGEAIESWSISRHAEDVTPGDRAVLWVGARKAPGVDAVGTITGVPREGVVDDRDWPGEPQGSPVLWCPIDFDVVECGHLTWPHFGRCSSRILAPSGW